MRTARADYPDRMCMTCDYFKLKGQPGTKEGRGLCTMYVEPQTWDWDRCILYKPADTMGDRLRVMERFQQKAADQLQKDGHGNNTEV